MRTPLRLAAAALTAGAAAYVAPLIERNRRSRAAMAPDLRPPRFRGFEPPAAGPALNPSLQRAEVALLPRDDGDPLRTYVYLPENEADERPAVVWLHGGGYIGGTARSDAPWCARLAHELGAVVVSPEYRLAPTHPFPAAHDDTVTALRWLHENATELGVDPARVIVGGDSAGGGLAAALVQYATDHAMPVAFQALVYPMLDDRTTGRRGLAHAYTWPPAANASAWTDYLGHPAGSERVPEYAAPARRKDLRGLPPAWIGVGDIDLFLDECVDYAERLRAAGVTVQLEIVPGMYHAADVNVPDAPRMKGFRDAIVRAMREAVGG